MASYQTIAHALHVPALTINGSRFIVDVASVSSAADALAGIEDVRRMWPDASHHCWAYRLRHRAQTRASDDGEPGGSAGRPILAQIEGHDLFDVLVVVTRYFGGTKLGVGGLIRAYGGTAGKALDQIEISAVRETLPLDIVFSYEQTKGVEAVLRAHELTPIQTDFDAQVRMRLDAPIEDLHELRESLIQKTSGRVEFMTIE